MRYPIGYPPSDVLAGIRKGAGGSCFMWAVERSGPVSVVNEQIRFSRTRVRGRLFPKAEDSMSTTSAMPAPPSSDKRWKLVDATIRRHGRAGQSLIECLHTMQECFGYLDEQGLRYIAAALQVPLSKVYGVATFYHLFSLKPQGEHTCVVCIGTACYIKGTGQILKALAESYGIKPGETTKTANSRF